MPADPAVRLAEAARRRHALTRAKAVRALRELDKAGATITFERVARAAGISRSWLYTQPDLRSEIERLREATRRDPAAAIPAAQRCTDASLLRRLQTSLERNQQLTEENQRLRRQLAHALGDQRATRQAEPVTQRRNSAKPVTIGPC
jgi:hypothetical protein